MMHKIDNDLGMCASLAIRYKAVVALVLEALSVHF
jgi:hypothetical protein